MSRAARKTRRRHRHRNAGPVLNLSVADYYRMKLTGQLPPAPTAYEDYRDHALRSTV